jgi:polysaccharide biosynthesis transport protein
MNYAEAARFDVIGFDFVMVLRHLWIWKLRILAGGLIGLALAILLSLSMAPRYQAEGNLIVRSESLTAPDADRAFAATAVNEAVTTTEQDVLTSEGLLRRVAEQLVIPDDELTTFFQTIRKSLPAFLGAFAKPLPPSREEILEEHVRFLRKAIMLVLSKGSSLITIRAVARTPDLSAAIVNSVLHLYMQDRTYQETRAASLIEQALRERLRTTKQQIDKAEAQLVELLQKPGAIESAEIPGANQRMSLIVSRLIDAKSELARRQAEYRAALERRSAEAGLDANSDVVNRLRSELALLQARLAGSMSAGGPEVLRRQLAEVHALQNQIANEVSRVIVAKLTAVTAAQATVVDLQAQVDKEQTARQEESSTAIALTGLRETLASLRRANDTLESHLIDLISRPSSLNAHILWLANPPAQPTFPRKSFFAIAGFLVGSVLTGISLLFAVHLRSHRPAAIQFAQMMQAPLLGGVPQIGNRRGQRRLLASAVETGRSPDGLGDTLYGVAMELEDSVRNGGMRSVIVTSARSGEGKTTIATALSRLLASMSLRVLLVDLDLRKPNVEALVSDVTDETNLRQKIFDGDRRLEVKVDRQSGLHIFTPFRHAPCGDPRRYLRSAELRDITAMASAHYDLLIFDTPPVLAVPDALIVARFSDTIILVAESRRTDNAEIMEVQRRLAKTKTPISGIILTKVTSGEDLSGVFTGYGRSPYGAMQHFSAARS